MNLFELFNKKSTAILEGGNLAIGQDQADQINLQVTNRSYIVPILNNLLSSVNNAFAKQYKTPLWSPELLKNQTFLSGSSLHFFNVKGISDEEFIAKKPKVGDIDTMVAREAEPNLEAFLTANKGKVFGPATLIGFQRGNEQFSSLWALQEPPIKVQIDLEFVAQDTSGPTDWARFSHSSSWEDLQAGVKGVFHKFLIGSLGTLSRKEFLLRKAVGRGKAKAEQDIPTTDNMVSFAVSSKEGGGLRAKYEPVLNDQGAPLVINGLQVMRALPPSNYEQDINKIFLTMFGDRINPKQISQLSNKFWSFTGLLDVMNTVLTPEEKQNVVSAFIEKLFGKGAQGLYRGDPNRDAAEKTAALDTLFAKLQVQKPSDLEQMKQAYMSSYKVTSESTNQEASYPGNIGMMELAKFYKMASDEQKLLFKKLVADGEKKLAWKLVQDIVGVKLQGAEFAENFADGRNPQDKGDAKRHGINTKASVSSLRKTAKQGGRKGQLAHWLANMKSGRAKHNHESLSEAEVKAQLRKGMPHLRDLKAVDFLDLLDEIHDGNGNFKLQNIPLNVKIDGFGGRFGKNADGQPFMGTSRTEPRYKAGFLDYHKQKGTTDPEILGRAELFDKLFGEMMQAIKMVDSKLGADFLVNKQVTCEVLFLPFATQTDEGKLKFVGIEYDQLPKGVQLALVPFRITDATTGEDIPESNQAVKSLTELGQQGSVMFIDNSLTQKEGLDVTEIINPLDNIDALKQIVSDTAGKRDRASIQLRNEVEEKLLPVKIALEKAIDTDPNIVGKDMLGQNYEGIVINSRLGPIKVTSQQQKDIIAQKNAAKAAARAEQPRENQNKTAVVAVGSFVGHIGHEQLWDYTVKKAKQIGGDPYLFIGNAQGKDDPIPPAVKVQTWHKMYPSYAKQISTVQQGGSIMQKIKHELINPLPGKPPRYDNIIIMVGEDQANMPIAGALMKAVNKFPGYEHVKVSLEVTPRGTGMSFTKLRNILKDPNATPEQQYSTWAQGFDEKKLGADWIKHLMDITKQGMGVVPAKPAPVVAERLFNALMKPAQLTELEDKKTWDDYGMTDAETEKKNKEKVYQGWQEYEKDKNKDKEVDETARMSAAVKLQRAFQRQQEKSTASRKRGEEVMAQAKKDFEKKQQDTSSNVKEFAPDDSSGGEEDTLLKFARMWYNGNDVVQQKVEQVLDRMGWEIGELESEEGGAFVIRAGDEHGDSYIGFAPDDLAEAMLPTSTFTGSDKNKLAPQGQLKGTAPKEQPTHKLVGEEKQKGVDGKACWKGYKRMGTKKKGGRTVDNCVKVGEGWEAEMALAVLKLFERKL